MTPWTHSDNLKENEVLSGLTKSFFKNRRQRVISKMLDSLPEDTKLKPLAEMEGKKLDSATCVLKNRLWDRFLSRGLNPKTGHWTGFFQTRFLDRKA